MNDRFRFRAWDKQDKELIYEAENTYDCQSYNGHTIWHDNFACLLDDEERYTVEQCTGLKDKNGKLIYEGDIVKRHSKYSEEEKDVILQVEWNCKGGRYITTDKKHDNWFFSMFDYEYEVIGNIHENPELLEA